MIVIMNFYSSVILLKCQEEVFYRKIKKCSVTIDVTPFIYKKSNKSYKILIETKIYTKGLIAYDKYITYSTLYST